MAMAARNPESRTRVYDDKITPGDNWHIYQATANLLGQAQRRDYARLTHKGHGPRPNNKIRKQLLEAEFNIGHDWARNIVYSNNDQHALTWRNHRDNRKNWHGVVEYAAKNPKNKKAQRRAQKAQANLARTEKGPSITHGGNKLWREAQSSPHLMEAFKERRWYANSLGEKGKNYHTNRLIRVRESGEITILVPKALRENYGLTPSTAHVVIGNITYRHGWNNILHAIQNHESVTYRFIRREKHWLLQATVSLPTTEKIAAKHVLAIDTNSGHLDACILDKYGNPRAFITLSVKEKRLSETLDRLLKWAARWGIDQVVMEELSGLQLHCTRSGGGRKNKMISSIPTGQLKRQLAVLCENNGWVFTEVNPAGTSAYTQEWESVCSRSNSSHQIASYLIGRRGLGLSIRRATRGSEVVADCGRLLIDLFLDGDDRGSSEGVIDSDDGERHSWVPPDELLPF